MLGPIRHTLVSSAFMHCDESDIHLQGYVALFYLPVRNNPLVRNLPLRERSVPLSATTCFTVSEKAARHISLEVSM